MELPSIREYEEVGAVLMEKIDRWEAEILERGIERGIEQGIEQGIERQRALLHRLAEHRVGPAAAGGLSGVVGGAAVGGARWHDRRGSPDRSRRVDCGLRHDCRLPGPREPRGFVGPGCEHPCTPRILPLRPHGAAEAAGRELRARLQSRGPHAAPEHARPEVLVVRDARAAARRPNHEQPLAFRVRIGGFVSL